MPWFAYAINDFPENPDIDAGLIEAETVADALAKIGDERANVYELLASYLDHTDQS